MGRYAESNGRDIKVSAVVRDVLIGVFVLVVVSMAGCPQYNVWQQGLAGKAALERAMQDRQIAIQEANAKKDAAVMLADAEIARARGVAEANKIIGDSLKGNEGYLRYLWIEGLKTNNMQVVYVPTEAGLPILEAGKMAHSGAPASAAGK
jgi:hypothetical protein